MGSLFSSSKLLEAAKKGDIETVKAALAPSSSTSASSQTSSSSLEHIDDTVDSEGKNALILASENGHDKLVQFLLQRGANINYKCTEHEWTPLIHAAVNNKIEVLKVLLEENKNQQQKSTSSSITSTSTSSTSSSVLEAKDRFEKTALFHAVSKNHLNVIGILLQGGSDVNTKDSELSTPLSLACTKGHFLLARLLVNNGADGTIANMDGYSCLMRACQVGHLLLVQMLVAECHVDPDEQNYDKQTALMFAASKGSSDIVRFLLDNGADPELKDYRNWDASRYADLREHRTIVLMLQTIKRKERVQAAAVECVKEAALAAVERSTAGRRTEYKGSEVGDEDFCDPDDLSAVKMQKLFSSDHHNISAAVHQAQHAAGVIPESPNFGTAALSSSSSSPARPHHNSQTTTPPKGSSNKSNPLEPLDADALLIAPLLGGGGKDHHAISVGTSPESSTKSSPHSHKA